MTTDVRHAVAEAVTEELRRGGRDASWLSDRTGIAGAVLRSKLAGRSDFTVADLGDIAQALDISVARLTP